MRISNQTPAYQPVAQLRRASSGSGAFGNSWILLLFEI